MTTIQPRPSDDYVLGTHDAEIERLGLQHRLWRHRVLDCWNRARIGAGQRVADIGAGPGFATLDLAEAVGASGHVTALERSAHFLASLQARMARFGVHQVTARAIDLDEQELELQELDATWCRWVLSFLRHPERLVHQLAAALRPGGRAIFHEYLYYRAWTHLPPRPHLEQFVGTVMASWRAGGGEPDIGAQLPAMLTRAGLTIQSARPLTEVIAPADPLWAWPAAFVASGAARLVESVGLSAAAAAALAAEFAAAEADPASHMLTPVVLEIVAVKP